VTEGPEARIHLANAAATALLNGAPKGRPLAAIAPTLARAARQDPEPGAEPLVDLRASGEARTYRLRQTEVDVPPDARAAGRPSRLAILVLDDVTPFRALDAARRDFLAAVSHELRTPVTSMHVAADLLLRDAAGPLTPEQRELAEIVRGDAERMKNLTARLLDLARVEIGNRRRGPVDLRQVAEDAAAGVRLVAAERGVSVQVEGGATALDADAEGLSMAASNLLANAVRHAASRVIVRASERPGGTWLEVEDDGPGLPAGAEEHVFDPLVQLGGPSGSAGLGLSIVRRVAEAHGGRAWAEPGPGGRFLLFLPTAEIPAAPAA
jgi:signal transduction histidine kinase